VPEQQQQQLLEGVLIRFGDVGNKAAASHLGLRDVTVDEFVRLTNTMESTSRDDAALLAFIRSIGHNSPSIDAVRERRNEIRYKPEHLMHGTVSYTVDGETKSGHLLLSLIPLKSLLVHPQRSVRVSAASCLPLRINCPLN
jgi:hypothetical protein